MHHDDCAQELIDHLEFLASCERRFGPAQALLRFGRRMDISCDSPKWMPAGVPKQCYANAAKGLFAALGRGEEIRYAEGYAISKTGLPLPIQHAWLVDKEGRVLDPTWQDHRDYLYYGIVFDTDFVLDMLEETGLVPGLLVNPSLMRSHLDNVQRFASAVAASKVVALGPKALWKAADHAAGLPV
jgi:hypothetical protein